MNKKRYIKRNDESCGGDCFDYTTKFFELSWWHFGNTTPMNGDFKEYESRPCTEKDVGTANWNFNYMYICPPLKGPFMHGSNYIFPNKNVGFSLSYKKDVVIPSFFDSLKLGR